MKPKVMIPEEFNKFKLFMDVLNNEDKIGLLFHSDIDGICSGVIIGKAIERLLGKKIDLRFSQEQDNMTLTDKSVRLLKDNSINKFISVDHALDRGRKNVEIVAGFGDILILDHHPKEENLNFENVASIKAEDLFGCSERYYSCTNLCYDLCSKLVNLDDLDFILSIGVVGEICYKGQKGYVDSILVKYGFEIKDDIFDSAFGKIVKTLNSAIVYDIKNIEKCFDELYGCGNGRTGIERLLKSNLKVFEKVIDEEVQNYIIKRDDMAKIHGDIIIFSIESKYSIASTVANILSINYYPDKTFIIYSKIYPNKNNTEEFYRIGGRRQDGKLDIGNLLQKAVEGLNGANAGGHSFAGGGNIRVEDLNKFLANLKKLHPNL